jgi:hypothetical protein
MCLPNIWVPSVFLRSPLISYVATFSPGNPCDVIDIRESALAYNRRPVLCFIIVVDVLIWNLLSVEVRNVPVVGGVTEKWGVAFSLRVLHG